VEVDLKQNTASAQIPLLFMEDFLVLGQKMAHKIATQLLVHKVKITSCHLNLNCAKYKYASLCPGSNVNSQQSNNLDCQMCQKWMITTKYTFLFIKIKFEITSLQFQVAYILTITEHSGSFIMWLLWKRQKLKTLTDR
jgi:hypothetical protein